MQTEIYKNILRIRNKKGRTLIKFYLFRLYQTKVPHKSLVIQQKVPHKNVAIQQKVPHKNVKGFAISLIISIFAAKRALLWKDS